VEVKLPVFLTMALVVGSRFDRFNFEENKYGTY